MKSLKVIMLFSVIFWFGCTSDKKAEKGSTNTSVHENQDKDKLPDSLPWNAEYNEQTQQLELKHSENKPHLTEREIVDIVNRKYSRIKLEIEGQHADTIALRIKDALFLTEQMGSAGAQTYLAEVTFSLTELPDVKAVKFDFEEGEHASPGTYTRRDFKYFN